MLLQPRAMHLLRRAVWQRRPTDKPPAVQRHSSRMPVEHVEHTGSVQTSSSALGRALSQRIRLSDCFQASGTSGGTNPWNGQWICILSPSFGISKDNFTGLITVEFKVVVMHPGLYICVEFRGSRCFVAGRYYNVSSANLQRKLPKVIVLRSPALTT